MLININAKKATFLKYMTQMGFTYKITQFELFIETIKKTIQRELLISLQENTLIEDSQYILGEEANIGLLQDFSLIYKVNEEYIVKIINEGILDFYLEDKKIKEFSKDIQKKAYTLSILKDLSKNNIINRTLLRRNFNDISNRFNKENLQATECLNSNGINLTDLEKLEIYDSINRSHIKIKLQSLGNSYKLGIDLISLTISKKSKHNKVYSFLIDELSNVDFLKKETSDIEIKVEKRSEIYQRKSTIDIKNNPELTLIYDNSRKIFNVFGLDSAIECIYNIKNDMFEEQKDKGYYNQHNTLFKNLKELETTIKNIEIPNLEDYFFSIIVDGKEKEYTYKSLLD